MTRMESSIIESPREWNKGKECDRKRLAFSSDKERWEPAKDRHKLTKGKSYVSTGTQLFMSVQVVSCLVKSLVQYCSVCVCVRLHASYFWVLPLVKSVTAPGLKIASVRMQSYLYSSHTLPAGFNAPLLNCVCMSVCVRDDWLCLF